MLSNTTLFFLVLFPALISLSCWPPYIKELIESKLAKEVLYGISALHWVVGISLFIYLFVFTADELLSNTLEIISVVAFYTLLGYRYAHMARWVERQARMHRIRNSIKQNSMRGIAK